MPIDVFQNFTGEKWLLARHVPKVKHASNVKETVTRLTIYKPWPRPCHTKHLEATMASFLWLVLQQTSALPLGKWLDLLKPKSALAKCFVLPLLLQGQDHTHAVAMTSSGIVHMVAKVPLRQW